MLNLRQFLIWIILIFIPFIVYGGLFYLKDLLLLIVIFELLFFIYLYVSKWFHIIIILILLELFILKIYFFSLFCFIRAAINNFFIFLFITLRVAEARVGISLLTILVRVHGEDIILIIRI